MNKIFLFITFIAIGAFLSGCASSGSPIRDGRVTLNPEQLRPGSQIDLTGQWQFKPAYMLKEGEQPASALAADEYVTVPVPQLLSRVQWWLDDSEDFKKFEQERLDRLGFDTERSDEGWYRLEFEMPEIPEGRHLFIDFDGVAMVSETYINGTRLGAHRGMFSRFSYDLTPHLKAGKNVLSVFVSMEKIPEQDMDMGEAVTVNLTASKVLTMSKGMFGPLSPNADNRAYDLYGIWQPVRLTVRENAQIEDAWFRPALDGADVQVELRSLSEPVDALLDVVWTDRKTGAEFAKVGPVDVTLGQEVTTDTLRLRNVAPKHWTPADPNLYRMVVTLRGSDGVVYDRVTHDVGFRTFEARGNRLYLNGKPYWLRGANHAPYGKNPWDPELPYRLIQAMHDANLRVTRTHATPWHETWYRAADEIGLGVSVEGIRPWALAGTIGTPPREVFEHWLREHEDVIKRYRNHPSILIWTIGNEMLLRDAKNIEKWKLMSEVVKATRRLDPSRPIVVSSDYRRDPEFYRNVLAPNGIDDGDIDDIHRYYGYYGTSNFVNESLFETEMKDNGGTRPFIGQEMSTGYPNLDDGLPVMRYVRDLAVPQAWAGPYSYPGSDPAIYLEEHRAVTKRWAEQLRYQRTDRTAGFMMFALECWFAHSYDPDRITPYPVVEAMRYAWAPLGLALETPRRRFTASEVVETFVHVTNDDEQFRSYTDLTVQFTFVDESGKALGIPAEAGHIGSLPYYEVHALPVRIAIPAIDAPRQKARLITRLMQGEKELSRTVDHIEIFQPVVAGQAPVDAVAIAAGLEEDLQSFIEKESVYSRFVTDASDDVAGADVILIGKGVSLDEMKQDRRFGRAVREGATAILFSPGEAVMKLFPNEIELVREGIGEYADFSPVLGTPLAEGLQPMDLKWWGRKGDDRTFISSMHHRAADGASVNVLLRFIPAHGYTALDKVPGLFRSVLSEIRIGKGRVWICDLDLAASVEVDPAAALFARNLLRSAADPRSTDHLPDLITPEAVMQENWSSR